MTQAQPSAASYRAKAAAQSAFIQAHFYDADAGLYRPYEPRDPDSNLHDFMWGNGVQFSSLVAAAHYDPATYKPVLYAFASGLKKYWNEDLPIPCFEAYYTSRNRGEEYYDDNEWLVITFTEAYALTKDKMFLDWARRTQHFALSGWDDELGGGIYWRVDHQSKNTCSNAPGSTAALCLYRFGKDKSDLEWALKIRKWMRATLLDTDGLYWDNINLRGRVERMKWTYNTALMIRTDVLLYEFLKDKTYLEEARRSADAGIKAWVDPATGGMADNARFNHLFAESLLRLYDFTKDVKYLNAVRANASFGDRHVRDPKGGYWDTWKKQDHSPDERKELIENAGATRQLWLLAPYQDPAELLDAGLKAAGKGQNKQAEALLRDAVASDPEGAAPHYRLWKLLTRLKKTEDAAALEAWMTDAASRSESLKAELTKLGWTGKQAG
jgi:uncharacterized protein YyaL (SSP411 family)